MREVACIAGNQATKEEKEWEDENSEIILIHETK
jgi:hypothetical protein